MNPQQEAIRLLKAYHAELIEYQQRHLSDALAPVVTATEEALQQLKKED